MKRLLLKSDNIDSLKSILSSKRRDTGGSFNDNFSNFCKSMK